MMIAMKCPSADQLRALSLGQFGDAHSDELFDHIRSCETCKAELETVECAEDSLIASLRSPDALADFDAEPQRNVAMAKALAALALTADASTCDDSGFLPQTIGEYEIVRPLGRGGMGNVYLARHTKLGRQVALKVLAGHRLADARMRDRFEAEMRAVGKLSHPNVVTAHDAREVDGTAVLVTEYIEGLDLGQLVQRTGPLAIADACEIARQTAVALQYTSGQGFVHRDVKPANVMLSKSGEVKLLDLGLARWERDDPQQTGMTGTGQTMGTADYVAPEQVNDSRTVDVRADIYSLGCTLFKLLTGAAPFADAEHATVFAKMTAHVSQSAPRLGNILPAAPAGLVKLVDAMLAKDPAMRPQSPQQVAEELARFARGSDLQQLATRAAALEPRRPQPAGDARSPESEAHRTLPLLRRRVPLPLAIGGGLLGVVLGIFLGIFIKIEYPDGTEVHLPLPPGSKVTMGDAAGAVADASTAKPSDPKYDAAAPVSTPRHPLQFAVLVDKDPANDEALRTAKKIIEVAERKMSFPASMGVGTWYPVAPGVTVPFEATRGGQRYAPVRRDRGGLISWTDVRGNLSATSTGSGRDARIEMHFEGDLAKRLNEVSKNNLNRHLAIIVGGRIIAAPRIVSELSDRVSLTGKFSEQEIRYLHDALDGLVTEPPRDEAASGQGGAAASGQDAPQGAAVADPVEALQGVWRFVRIAFQGTQFPTASVVMAFQDDNYYVCNAGAVIGGGEFLTTRRENHVEIEFLDQLVRSEPMDVFLSLYRILPDGRLELQSDRLTQSVRPSPDAEVGSQGWVTYRLERLGDVPQTPEEARALGERMRGYQGHAEFVQALMTLAKVSQTPPESLKAFASETKPGEAQSRENLKAIGLAFHNFHDVYNKFPGSANTLEGSREPRGYPFSWRVAILPFIEHQELFEQYRFDEPWDSEHNRTLIPKMPQVYRSPYGADRGDVGETPYQGLVGEQTALGAGEGISMRTITDGNSNTILVVETQSTVPWTKPQDLPFEVAEIAKQIIPFDDQPLHFVTADGAVHTMDPVDWKKLPKLITRNGGEHIEP